MHTVPKSITLGSTRQQVSTQVPTTLTVPHATGPQALSVTSVIMPM